MYGKWRSDRGWDSPKLMIEISRAQSLHNGTMIEENNIYSLNFLGL